jgi:hypothetical protein
MKINHMGLSAFLIRTIQTDIDCNQMESEIQKEKSILIHQNRIFYFFLSKMRTNKFN